MRFTKYALLLSVMLTMTLSHTSQADDKRGCIRSSKTDISFVEIQSRELSFDETQPFGVTFGNALTVKGKLSLPAAENCNIPEQSLPAVVILHGSAGVDLRGDFYARALNAAGIATLEIDMWGARGVTGVNNRPPLPVITYPDVFAALSFLAAQPNIDPDRIGALGFSWGGVLTMASATEKVAQYFGGNLRFKAHVANYPICYAYNNPYIPNSNFGSQASNPLTGAPIMIQIGSLDDYDESAAPCLDLKASLPSNEQQLVKVVTYEGATHTWDRLMVPFIVEDPFSHKLAGGPVNIVPDVDQAYESQRNVVRFFQRNL